MTLTIERAQTHERLLVERLLQLHLYEGGAEPGPDGVIDWGEPLDKFFSDRSCVPLLFREDGKLVGFALAKLNRKPPGPDGKTAVSTHFIEEFFVLRGHRRKGLGTRAVELLFGRFPGRWMTTTWPGGTADRFWRSAVMGRHGARGREYGPGEHQGFPGQYVWVVEPMIGGDRQ